MEYGQINHSHNSHHNNNVIVVLLMLSMVTVMVMQAAKCKWDRIALSMLPHHHHQYHLSNRINNTKCHTINNNTNLIQGSSSIKVNK